MSQLTADVFGRNLSRNVVVEFGQFRDDGDDTCYLPFEWTAEDAPNVYPRMVGALEIFDLGRGQTQISFIGHYRPPGPPIGELADAVVGGRVADSTVRALMAKVAQNVVSAVEGDGEHHARSAEAPRPASHPRSVTTQKTPRSPVGVNSGHDAAVEEGQ